MLLQHQEAMGKTVKSVRMFAGPKTGPIDGLPGELCFMFELEDVLPTG